MKIVFETVAEIQKASVVATGEFTDNVLASLERMMQLNIETSRSVLEKSSEITLVCLEGYLTRETPFPWNPFIKHGTD